MTDPEIRCAKAGLEEDPCFGPVGQMKGQKPMCMGHGMPRRVMPSQVVITGYGGLLGTLGHAELEFAGAMVMRYQQLKGGDEWVPMPTMDFWDVLKADKVTTDWSRNPVWRPDLKGLITGGWIEGWKDGDPEAIGTVTEKFIEAVSHPNVGAKGGQW